MLKPRNTNATLKNILSHVSEADIVNYYLGVTKLPCKINSPFRQDKNPSLGIFASGDRVFFNDFGSNDKGNIYTLLSKYFNLDYYDLLQKIYNDMIKCHLKSDAKLNNTYNKVHISGKSRIECKIREWDNCDVNYWSSYGVTIDALKKADVYPISHQIVYKDGKRYVFKADKLAYAFIERKEGNITKKIYQPLNTTFKWLNTHDSSVVSLWSTMPEFGDEIYICSSLKDALCFTCNTNKPAIALQGEGYGISKTAINELKRRFKKQYIIFDNDEPGLIDAKKLSEETGFINLVIPQFEGGKDLSDYYKCYGKKQFINLIDNLNYE